MDMTDHRCRQCGGQLMRDQDAFICCYCGNRYDAVSAEQYTQALRALLDEAKMEMVGNLRRNLYLATTAPYISRDEVQHACMELQKYLPDDFSACFYRTAAGTNIRALNAAINSISVEKHYGEIGMIVEFLVKSMTADADYLLALNNLVERAYKTRDLSLFSRYASMVSEQAARVRQGIYETALPRTVFVAYSGKDMERVSELVEALEEQGFSCFVAMRNLRHGIGSVENYEKALREAMDSCRIFLFVSGMNSRNMSCDALTVEMSYIKNQDIAAAPPEYRHNYAALPIAFKKPRIEYRIQESDRFNIADTVIDEFFSGYERVYEPMGVMQRIAQILLQQSTMSYTAQPVTPPPSPPVQPPKQAPFVLTKLVVFSSDGTINGKKNIAIRYRSKKTSYIGITCHFRPTQSHRTADLTWQILQADGSAFSDELHQTYDIHPGYDWVTHQWGWPVPGNWPVGRYQIVASINGSPSLRQWFEICP